MSSEPRNRDRDSDDRVEDETGRSPDSESTEQFVARFLAATKGVDPRELLHQLTALASEARVPAAKAFELPPRPETPVRIQLRADLVGARPPLWRRLVIPGEFTMADVHDVLKEAFGWTNSHLHRFDLGAAYSRDVPGIVMQYEIDEGDDGILESTVTLDQVVSGPGDAFTYTYDFGDNWSHRIVVEKVESLDEAAPDARPAQCLVARRNGPPEDIGGIHSFDELLAAAREPSTNQDEWVQEQLEHYGPEFLEDADAEVNIVDLNARLSSLSAARAVPAWLAEHPSPLADLILKTLTDDASRYAMRVLGACGVNDDRPAPSEADAARATAVIGTFLSFIPPEGVSLTTASYLRPSVVSAMMAELDPKKWWIGEANREIATPPLLNLRTTVSALGLTRVRKGHFGLTVAGAKVAHDPVALWRHIAKRLPVESGRWAPDIGMLLLLLVGAQQEDFAVDDLSVSAAPSGASASSAALTTLIDELDWLTGAAGWHFERSNSYSRSQAFGAVRSTVDVLTWAATGELFGSRGMKAEALLSDGARELARAALREW
ncbi:plasmid pRiA4b ORF-3 family protein [Subtercola lobariae]|uniref:Plasmid pRiA4b Orf3-like domain-containing protein n=1 Tax=Subtercola lobariae TaxID=1588641 RepID=A0A917B1V4_9MICO|nr:plasmid pRiA4b ORF-3 family protein [Subtercola lobariae]GGF15475.1 hypothetical protein GCM10011399_06590 [Subtercola lobariae]